MSGTFVDSGTIMCQTPEFTRLGPAAVEVRVAIGGNAYTNTYQKFSFFDVADAAKIVAFGPALIPGGAAGQATSLIVQSKDTADNDRITGGDEFEVLVVSKKGVEVEDVAVEDMETGQYLVTFTPPTADDYTISIEFKGTFKGHPGQIRGGPFSTSFVDGLPDGTNAVNGKLVLHKMRENIGEMSTFANETLSGIRKPVKEGDVDSLLKVRAGCPAPAPQPPLTQAHPFHRSRSTCSTRRSGRRRWRWSWRRPSTCSSTCSRRTTGRRGCC